MKMNSISKNDLAERMRRLSQFKEALIRHERELDYKYLECAIDKVDFISSLHYLNKDRLERFGIDDIRYCYTADKIKNLVNTLTGD